MKITHLTMYGFGKWKDHSLEFSKASPQVIIGENEAGKSTIYEFILFILFGLPPKQRRTFFPKSGGSMGGRIVLFTEEYGKVTIERTDAHENGRAFCHLETGEVKDESWLQRLLHGMERSVFESTYSFNADGLMELKNLSGQALGEVLLNIGLTGSRHIYQTEKQIQKQMEERFKPNGRKPLINQQLQTVEELEQQKRMVDDEEGEYLQFQQREEQLRDRLTDLDERWEEKVTQLYITEQVMKVREVLVDYHLQKAEVECQPTLRFPESGVERYQQVKEWLLPLQSEQQVLETNKAELCDSLQVWEGQLDHSSQDEAKELIDTEQAKYEHADYEFERLMQEVHRLEEQLEEDKSHIDIPIDVEELEDYSLPFYIEETWHGLKKGKEDINREQSLIEEQLEDVDREFEKLEERKKIIEKSLISEDAAREFEEKLQTTYRTPNTSENGNHPLKKRRLMSGTMAVLALLAGGLLEGMVLFLICLVIAAGFGIYSYRIHTQLSKASEAKGESSVTVEEIEEARIQLRQFEAKKNEYTLLREEWKQLNQEEIRLQEKNKLLLQRQRRLDVALEEQQNLYPFLNNLQVDHWPKLFHLLTSMKERIRTKNHLNKNQEKLSTVMDTVKNRVKSFWERKNWEFYEDNIGFHWKQLNNWVKEQNQVKQNMNHAEEQLKSIEKRIKENAVQLSMYLEQREELLQEAGAEDEEEFYAKAKQADIQIEQTRQVQELEHQILRMLSKREQDDYQVWMEAPEESVLLSKQERQKSEKLMIEKEQKEVQQQRADNQSAIRQLEHSDARSSITHRLHQEKTKLQELMNEWAVYQMAWKSLEKTKLAYKEKYFPEIVKKAAGYFGRLTGGNYIDVKISPDDDQLKVQDEKGFMYSPVELSRGTKDQLYVSFRLALGETMAEELSLPFLVDDAFVHFDQKRLNVMTELIEEISQKHQVILFTWREDFIQQFQSPQLLQLT